MNPDQTSAPGPHPLQRFSIVGVSGSGKTTLGAQLSRRLNLPVADLDEMHWLPGWQTVPEAEFRTKLRAVIEGEGWIISGNYSSVRGEVWAQAQVVVWLDYSFPFVAGRLLKRTFRRVVRGETCCNGNRETLRLTFSKDSILLWLLKTYRRRRRSYLHLLDHPDCAHLQIHRFTSPRQTQRWLDALN